MLKIVRTALLGAALALPFAGLAHAQGTTTSHATAPAAHAGATSHASSHSARKSGATNGQPININTASQKELESLRGIGKARSHKIIAGRPYKSTEELESKKIIPAKVYNEIKGQITTR